MVTVGGLLPLLLLPRTAAADFIITSEGQPRATLILAPQPNAYEEQAVRELSSYFERISGAQLPTSRGDGGATTAGSAQILIGRAAIEFAHLRMPRREFTEDGFMLKVQDGALLVAGAGPRGTLFAARRLLEEIGCRWFLPGEFGEVVPQRPSIIVPDLDISSKPHFRYRHIATDTTDEPTRLWAFRNGLVPDGSLVGKSLEELVPPEEFFADHPEFYALVDGVRRPPHLCLSKPQVLEVAASRALQFFRRNSQVDSLLLFDRDPEGFCEDEGCRALDVGEVDPVTGFSSVTDRALKFANALAARVTQEMPGKSFLFLASGPTAPPPRREPVSEAVVPVISTSPYCPFHAPPSRACLPARVLDLYLRRWCALSLQVRVLLEEPAPAARELPFSRSRFLGGTLRYLRELGVEGVDLVGGGDWVGSGLNRYLAGRLLWDTSLDVSSLKEDFYNRFYVESAGGARAFYEAIEAAMAGSSLHRAEGIAAPLVFNSEVIALLSWHLQSANEEAVSPTTKHHLELPNSQFRYLSAFLTVQQRAGEGRFVEALRSADYASRILQQVANWQGGSSGHQTDVLADLRSLLAEDVARAGANGEAILNLLPTGARFKPDPQGLGEAEEWFRAEYGDSSWSSVSLDYPWELQGFADYHGNAFYRVSFRVGQIAPGKRYTLRFAALFGSPSIYLNGVFVGRKGEPGRPSPSKPVASRGLEFDVTGFLTPEQTNLLTVKVNQPSPRGWSGPCGPIFIYARNP